MTLFDLHWQDQTDKAHGVGPYLVTTYGTLDRALAALDRIGARRRDGASFVFDVDAAVPCNVAVAELVERDTRLRPAA